MKKREARFRESVLQYQLVVLSAQKEVEDAIVGLSKARETSTAIADVVDEIDEASGSPDTLYQTEAIDFNRVYVIQSIQVQQQEQLALSRANEILQLIRVDRALGGDWKIGQCPDFASAQTCPKIGSGDPDQAAVGESEESTGRRM